MHKLTVATLVMLLQLLHFSPLQAQETLLTVGVPGDIPSTNSLKGNISGETISTAQIDGVLRTVAPSTFGQNFTRDRANRAFADFANFRVSLASSLTQAIPAASSRVRRVNSISISTSALNLRLAQKTNSVSGTLGKISTNISVLVNGIPIICPSANASFSINNITISGDYNFISGDISGTVVDYTIENISTSCNGFFGFLGDVFNAITGIGNSLVRTAVASAANQAVTFGNMKQLFSLADFANGLSRFRSETPLSAVANRGILIFQEMVNDAAINTPGIVLDFGVEFATGIGEQNKISVIASNAPTDARPLNGGSSIIDLIVPQSTNFPIDLYISSNGSNWRYLTSASTESVRLRSPLPSHTRVIAIGRNSFIPTLESFPGNVGIALTPVCPNGRPCNSSF
jgi:hypothetical protein